jgi:FKBP-type peptidyl-prolyl cis-trans isomerase SlyD
VTAAKLTVADDLVVRLDYSVRLSNGEVIDTTTSDGREPVEFLQGRGQIFPRIEQELYGMAVGDEKELLVAPADGFGEWHPEATLWVPRHRFSLDMTLRPGMKITIRDNAGRPIEAYVAEVRPDSVLLDFNHPLAGKTLYFWLRVSNLRPATSSELDSSST